MKNKFLIVLPWYGALPPYFDIWLRSLFYVKMDVLFVTDVNIQSSVPDNFHICKLTIEDVRNLAQRKLETEVALKHPRKLCDLKPFYGAIFEDYINGYDYWGFGDCDLIYGYKLNEYLEEILKGQYDVATCKQRRISGGLTFVRNEVHFRYLAMDIEDWKYVLADEHNFVIDEIRNWLKFSEIDTGRCTLEDIRKDKNGGGDSFSAVVWRTPGIKVFSKDIIVEKRLYFYSRVCMNCGALTYNRGEIAIFHYVGIKSFQYFNMNSSLFIKSDYYVVDSGGFIEGAGLMSLLYRETLVILRWIPKVVVQKCRRILVGLF